MFEAAVDRFGRAIAGVGVVEVGQDVPGSAFECPAQCDDFMVKFWPDTPAALTESIPGQVHDMEGIHDRPRAGEFFSGGALKPGESIHRDDLNALASSVGLGGQPGFEDLFGAARDHVQKPGGAAAVADGHHVQDDINEFVAVGGVAQHVSTLRAPVAAHAHMQDRGTPLAGYVRQAPGQRATTNALAPAASTPPILTSDPARQHCMVWLQCAGPSPPTPGHPGP